MDSIHFDRFLKEAVRTDRETDGGLGEDELYGLSTSWCVINRLQPECPKVLWAALRDERIEPKNNDLSMTGPAATGYIVSSAPNVV
ncbi:hypothetical protein [Arthrobacter oryzae]|uniref:hypothetical protein n=1 Tax=Arthrobacter oryzae TaxID=409290 RepID=UPI0027836874|nr:hypothetical protein [Arthrobacter oryzae]MDQ0075643.1 hypothetical protein [Arthrobacter oryzae]